MGDQEHTGLPEHFEMIEKLAKEIDDKKQQVIKQRLEEMGMAHLLDNLEEQRFKRILVEKRHNEETYYADDGTLTGRRIVTFLIPKWEVSIDEYLFNFQLKYY